MRTANLLTLFVLLTGAAYAQHPAAKAKQPAPKQAPVIQTTPAVTQLPSDEFFEHFVMKHTDDPTPEGYGLSPDKLIPIGAYEEDLSNQTKINQQMGRFLKTIVWADGSPLIYVDHASSLVDGVNVDRIRLTKLGSKDTLTLYADEYKTGTIFLPKGFKFYTKAQLAAEIAPALAQVRQYLGTPDRYTNAKSKSDSFLLLGFIQSNIGLEYMMDNDYLATILNDVGVDLDFKAYLVRSYMFHKFENMATNQPNASLKSFNQMVDDYKAVIKTNDIMLKGQLAGYMVKK
jgi:hypothetical protein